LDWIWVKKTLFVVDWIGLGQQIDGLDWIGFQKMDPCTTLLERALPRPRLESNLEPAEHSARHALLHMASEWSSHMTTRAAHYSGISPKKIASNVS